MTSTYFGKKKLNAAYSVIANKSLKLYAACTCRISKKQKAES